MKLSSGLRFVWLCVAAGLLSVHSLVFAKGDDQYSRSLTFADLGLNEPLKLRGVDSEISLPFGIRQDEAVVSAQLELGVDFSPALLERLSHVVVRLNGEIVKTISLGRSAEQLTIRKLLDVDPRLFTDYNQLSLQFVGHYTLECEDAAHSSLWAQFARDSSLRMQLVPLGQRGGLENLPEPFFDPRDNRQLVVPMVFARLPSLSAIKSAGVLASWFGNLAAYRGARFPVVLNQWPDQHAVLLITNDDIPDWLNIEPTDTPQVKLIRHPEDHQNLLVLHGKDDAQLHQAVLGAVYGYTLLTGDSAVINAVSEPPERKAYDVPKWIRTDRKVLFSELVDDPMALQVNGRRPLPVRVNARIPPDLYTGHKRIVDMDLRYRYSKPLKTDNSSLAVFINERFIQSIRLESEEQSQGFQLRLPVVDAKRYEYEADLDIPALQIESNNQLQFQFSLDYHSKGICKDTPWDDVHAAIEPDSSIDLTGFSHFVEMPNLALFSRAGYPFTRFADLSKTSFVLPTDYGTAEIGVALELIGQMANQTGVTASRFEISTPPIEATSTNDLLLIGIAEKEHDEATPSDRPVIFRNAMRQLDASLSPQGSGAAVAATIQAGGTMGALVGYQSNLSAGQSIVAVLGTTKEGLLQAAGALSNPPLRDRIRGAAVVVNAGKVRVLDSATSYSLGNLSLRDRVGIFFANYPVLLSLIGVIIAVLLAFTAFVVLRQVASRRLET